MTATELDRLIELSVSLDDDRLLALSEDGEDHVFSDAYDAKMQSLFRHKPKARKRTSPLRYAVASILIVIALGGAVTAGAFWSEIVAFFETIYSQHANFALTPNPSTSPLITDSTLSSWDEYWFPSYMTEHHEFDSAVEWGDLKQITFISNQGYYIDLYQMPGTATLGNDIEGVQIPDILVGDFDAFAFEKNVDNATLLTLAWSDGKTSFRLVGQVPLEELISIAEHLAYVENTTEG